MARESTANLLTKLAFEFLVLTAARSGEVRHANWNEIRWERRTWEIPAIKMKARRPAPGPVVRQGDGDPARSLGDIRT